MKLFVVSFTLLFVCFFKQSASLNADKYAAFIEQLDNDEHFLEEYTKWTRELFSQPDYLYGIKSDGFPCSVPTGTPAPTSVHNLRPSDIKCIGALGDSLTAGLGAHALTPIGLLTENRGLSWSVGGDHTYSRTLSVPNILKEYNPKIQGYSTKEDIIFLGGQNATNNRLNVAKSGARSDEMLSQAQILFARMKKESLCDWDNDWKMITLFIGGNDLCSFCEDGSSIKYTPQFYKGNVQATLDFLYNAPLPRTFVNLVLVLDVRGVEKLNAGGFTCQLLHKNTCPCAAFPTPEQRTTLDSFVPAYQNALVDLIDSGRYDGRDDFTVVIQPFMAKTDVPLKPNGQIDYSYFAPDCFHFSAKGHANAALSLWNNMFEPVGAKQWSWHIGETLKCPTDQYPYIFTKKNSPSTLAHPRSIKSALSATTETTSSIETTESPEQSTHHHRHHDRKHRFDFSLSKLSFVMWAGIVFLLIILIVVSIANRQRVRDLIRRNESYPSRCADPSYDNIDEVEVWSGRTSKISPKPSDALSKTHGARINFD